MQRTDPQPKTQPTCCLISLGCPKNLVDSERMLGLLEREGFRIVREPEGSDLVVVNTCGFIEAARQESLETIGQVSSLKKQGKVASLIVAGCLAQRNQDALLKQCPGVDHLVGVFGRDEIARAARCLAGEKQTPRAILPSAPACPLPDIDRHRVTPKHVAYLKISEGCDRSCTFCSIPSIRGKHVSKPIDQIVAEAEQLAADGVRELVLIGQDTSYFGIDLAGRPLLAELLDQLCQLDGLAWIRLMYLYPIHLTDALIERVAAGGKVLPYLDLPLQHISDPILRRMNRRISREETEALLERLRERIPGLVLRTTLIAGFPGETERQFEELLTFVREQRFERLGVFSYSCEPGTPAARLDGHLPAATREARRDRLMTLQQEIAHAWNEAQVGTRCSVLVDRYIPEEEDAFLGRSPADAPEVDGAVYVTGKGLAPGQMVACEIVAAGRYDLIGVAVEPPR